MIALHRLLASLFILNFFATPKSPAAEFHLPDPAVDNDAAIAALRSAIEVANTNGEADTIHFFPGGEYVFREPLFSDYNGTLYPRSDALPAFVEPTTVTLNGNGARLIRNEESEYAFRFAQLVPDCIVHIQNLSFENGLILNSSISTGGALVLHDATALLEDCRFLNNKSSHVDVGGYAAGGAIFIYGSDVVLRDSVFSRNVTGSLERRSRKAQGGAVFVASGRLLEYGWPVRDRKMNSVLSVEECSFEENRASGKTVVSGGAIHIESAVSSVNGIQSHSTIDLNISDSFFEGNIAEGSTQTAGGAFSMRYNTSRQSLGAQSTLARCRVTRSVFSNNRSVCSERRALSSAMEVVLSSYPDIGDYVVDLLLSESLFVNNRNIGTYESTKDSALSFVDLKNYTPEPKVAQVRISNSTLLQAGHEKIFLAAPNIDMRLSNSLLLSDSSSTEPLISAAFHSLGHNIITSYDSTATTLTATDRVGLTASEVVETTVTLAGGTTPTLRLLPFSPAVNAGDPAWVGTIGATDQRGAPRVAGGRIDIGAYELQAPTGAPAFWLGDLDGANDPLPGYSNDPAILLTFPLQGDEEEPAWLDVWSSDLPGTPTLLASHPDGEATAVLTVSGPDGEKHLAGRLVNAVGASDAVATAVVVLDRVPPRGQLAYPQTPAPRPGVGATVIEIAADGPADGTGSPVARHEVAARWLGSPGGEFAAVGDLLTSPSLPLWPDRAGTYVLRSELTDGAGNRVQTLHDDRPVTFDGDIQRPYKKGVATPHRRGVATPVHQNK